MSKWQIRMMAFALLLIALLVAGCLAPIKRPTPGITLGSAPVPMEPVQDCRWLEDRSAVKYEVENYWVKNQVIVVLPEATVEATIKELQDRLRDQEIVVDFRPLEICSIFAPFSAQQHQEGLERLQKAVGDKVNNLPYLDPEFKLQKILFQLDAENPKPNLVKAVVDQINALRNKERVIYADPNYLVGPSGNSNCSEVGSAPHGVATGPFGHSGPGIITNTAGLQTNLMHQWAIQQIGLTNSSIPDEDQDVQVLIFDTSPIPASLLPAGQSATINISQTINISTTTSNTLALTVWNPLVNLSLQPSFKPVERANEHGLFVAGLVQAVAPHSHIHLIRVLNDVGCGDVNTLMDQVSDFLFHRMADKKNIVVNFSLTIDNPTLTTTQQIQSEIAALGNQVSVSGLYTAFGVRNIIFVSASGNSHDQFAQLPARWDYVIGVSASNRDRKSACFSNPGDIAAPGGDGEKNGSSCTPLSNLNCSSGDSVCSKKQADNNLLSIVTVRDPQETGYAYWSGTSFAAPLVSGAAARLLGSLGPAPSPSAGLGVIKALSIAGGIACPPPVADTILGAGILQLDSQCP